MITKASIVLSDGEMELVCNQQWILTKHGIIEKVYQLFGNLAAAMQQTVQQQTGTLPAVVTASSPKISRGENYKMLPYVMLDYPRHFTKPSTVAIRTLFWWGNFFSINLHLAGEAKHQAAPLLQANLARLQQQGYWLCVHTDPWQHHFEAGNYVPLKNFTAEEFAGILGRETFIKIAAHIPLQQWIAAPLFLEKKFNEMLKLLQINFQGDETDLSPGIPKAGFDL